MLTNHHNPVKYGQPEYNYQHCVSTSHSLVEQGECQNGLIADEKLIEEHLRVNERFTKFLTGPSSNSNQTTDDSFGGASPNIIEEPRFERPVSACPAGAVTVTDADNLDSDLVSLGSFFFFWDDHGYDIVAEEGEFGNWDSQDMQHVPAVSFEATPEAARLTSWTTDNTVP
jgi:hypothetical protein